MLSLLAVLATGLMTFSCGTPLPAVPLVIGSAELTVEVATTPETRACGLSQRAALPSDRGMLFVFPDPGPRAFWMKDTRIALSIAFLDADKTVMNTHDMTPLDTGPRYTSEGEASYALEVNQGWFEAHDVEPGSTARFSLPRVLLVE